MESGFSHVIVGFLVISDCPAVLWYTTSYTTFTLLKLLHGLCSDLQGSPDLGEYRADNPYPVNPGFLITEVSSLAKISLQTIANHVKTPMLYLQLFNTPSHLNLGLV